MTTKCWAHCKICMICHWAAAHLNYLMWYLCTAFILITHSLTHTHKHNNVDFDLIIKMKYKWLFAFFCARLLVHNSTWAPVEAFNVKLLTQWKSITSTRSYFKNDSSFDEALFFSVTAQHKCYIPRALNPFRVFFSARNSISTKIYAHFEA